MNARDEITEWLRDAYAMERSLELTLKKISESDATSVECRTAAATHLAETRQHAQIVESLLRSLASDTSSFKTGFGVMAETMKSFGAVLSHDEEIKDLLSCYSMEHFEIACYEALAAAAEVAGLPHVVTACRQIIMDEEKMAKIVHKELPRVVQEYLGAASMAKAA